MNSCSHKLREKVKNMIIMIIIISTFKEDNAFSMTANLSDGPPMNRDICL